MPGIFTKSPVITRREPDNVDREFYGQEIRSYRQPLAIYPQEAPEPPRDSERFADNKAPGWAWARHDVAFTLNIAGSEAVGEQRFMVPKPVVWSQVATPIGAHAPLVERANIERQNNVIYGSMQQVPGSDAMSVLDLRVQHIRGR